MPLRLIQRRVRPRRGQSLVELAVILPILLLLLGGAIDLGRVFFTNVTISNAAKEGALFGATAPGCDVSGPGCADPGNVAWHVQNESPGTPLTINVECIHAGTPVSVTTCVADDTYRVTVSHRFTLVTPLVSAIFGNGIDLSSSATAVVFSSAAAVGSAMPFPSSEPLPSANPPGMCLVPQLIGLKANKTDGDWADRNFTGAVTKSGGPGNFDVAGQSLQSGTWWPCESGITVSSSAISPSPAPTTAPTATPTATPVGATPTPTPSASASATPTPTPSPTPLNCRLVPTLEGFTVSQARTKWADAGFTGPFIPVNGQNNKTVTKQTTSPASIPGDCIAPTATVTVTYQ